MNENNNNYYVPNPTSADNQVPAPPAPAPLGQYQPVGPYQFSPAPKKKSGGKIFLIIIIVLAALGAGGFFGGRVLLYNIASNEINTGNYDEAIEYLEILGEYNNSPEKILEAKYGKAQQASDNGEYLEASELFLEIETYSDALEKSEENMGLYILELIENNDLENAKYYMDEAGTIANSDEIEDEYNYALALQLMSDENYETAAEMLEALGDFKESKKNYAICGHNMLVMAGYGKINHIVVTEIFKELKEFNSDPEIKKMLEHPIYVPAKLVGKWRTSGGQTLEYKFDLKTGYMMNIGFPVDISRKVGLEFNGFDICSNDGKTVKTIFTVVRFEQSDSIQPEIVVIKSLKNNKEYEFKRR